VRSAGEFFREFARKPYLPFVFFALISALGAAFVVLAFKPVLTVPMMPGDLTLAYVEELGSPLFQAGSFMVALLFITFPLVHVLVYLKGQKVAGRALSSMYLILAGFVGAAGSEYVFLLLLPARGVESSARPVVELVLMGVLAFGLKARTFLSEITGEPEANLPSALKYHLEAGHTYLIEEESFERSVEIFSEQVTHGVRGLCITRNNPEQMKSRLGLVKTPIVWLTDTGRGSNVVPPQLEDVSILINEFTSQGSEGVILLDGVEYLILKNDYNKVVQMLERLKDSVSLSKCRLIVPVNPKTLAESERALLERELADVLK